jgi:hypothetical protein
MDFKDEKHLDVCQNIEYGLKHCYAINPRLTDSLCALAIDNAKIAIKQQFGFAKNEHVTSAEDAQAVIDWRVTVGLERIGKINDLTLKEYVSRLEKIKSSVVRHSKDGKRSYYERKVAFRRIG